MDVRQPLEPQQLAADVITFGIPAAIPFGIPARQGTFQSKWSAAMRVGGAGETDAAPRPFDRGIPSCLSLVNGMLAGSRVA